MFDKEVLTRIAKNLGLDAELFAADPFLFLTEHELGKVLKAYFVLELNGEVIYKIQGTTPQPTIIADDDDDMDGSPF